MRAHTTTNSHPSVLAACIILVAAPLLDPRAGRADTIYVSYNGNNTIQRFDSVTGGSLGVFASTGLNQPEGLAFDSAGNLFVANYGNNSIMKFTPGGVGSVFASTGLSRPEGLAFDSAGNLYVANWAGGTISKFTPDGVGSTFATDLSFPGGLAIDGAGNVFVANHGDNTIKEFTPAGVGSVFASYPDVYSPGYLAFDNAGNLYWPNGNNNNIVRFTPGGVGSEFAAGLTAPLSLDFDSAGHVFLVCESAGMASYNKIVEYAADGSYLGLIASPGFNLPWGIAIIPEPSTWALLGLGIAALPGVRRLARERTSSQ